MQPGPCGANFMADRLYRGAEPEGRQAAVSSQYRFPQRDDISPARSRVRRRSRVGLGVVAAGAAVLAVVAAGFGGYRLLSHPSCAGQIQLAVTVAPEIDPA